VAGPSPAAAKALVDLNSASVEELNRLGAGRVGRAIVRGRPYSSTEDLVRKRVLNRTAFGRIKDQVRAGNNLAAQ
jgi:DNA uptake protein ComE-like DNA-binding protein